jgi:hypothetical protein
VDAGNQFRGHPAWRANKRTPLANLGKTWRRTDIGVKDNGPGCLGGVVYVSVYVGVILVGQGCSDTEITQQDGTVIVDEEVCCFDIPMNKSVDMQIIEALEGLPEDTAYHFLFHAAGPSILHDIGGASCVHKAESDMQFMAI